MHYIPSLLKTYNGYVRGKDWKSTPALCEHSWDFLREVVICEHLIDIFSPLTIQQ